MKFNIAIREMPIPEAQKRGNAILRRVVDRDRRLGMQHEMGLILSGIQAYGSSATLDSSVNPTAGSEEELANHLRCHSWTISLHE